MPAGRPERRVEALAAGQHGVIGRDQALHIGMAARTVVRRAATGQWVAVHPGVYRAASTPASWESELMAALLWAGPGSAASHRAAGRLWGIESLADAPVEITARMGRTRPGVIVHRLRPEDQPRIRRKDGLSATAPERTMLDLCAALPLGPCATALDELLHRRLTTVPRIQRALEREGGSGRRGTAALRRLLEIHGDPRIESELERRFLRILRRAGLPRPDLQHEVRLRGRLVARLDFAYPAHRLGFETHGFRWHGGRERWQRDVRRENRLKRLGWTVLVFTWADVVGEPTRVLEETRAFLASRRVLPRHATYGAAREKLAREGRGGPR